MRQILFVVVAALASTLPRAAAAQEAPRFGLVMGYPAQVGVLWNVSGSVALRPEVSWTRSTSETTSTSTTFGPSGVTTTFLTTTSTSTAFGVGVSGLIRVWSQDALRVYVSPRFAFTRQSTTIDLGLPASVAVPAVQNSTADGYSGAGSVGAQYDLARHFGLFGELGMAYTRTTVETDSLIGRPGAKNSSTGLRSGVGVILFF